MTPGISEPALGFFPFHVYGRKGRAVVLTCGAQKGYRATESDCPRVRVTGLSFPETWFCFHLNESHHLGDLHVPYTSHSLWFCDSNSKFPKRKSQHKTHKLKLAAQLLMYELCNKSRNIIKDQFIIIHQGRTNKLVFQVYLNT